MIDFPVVPSGKTAEIVNVSCYLNMTPNAPIIKVQLQQVLATGRTGVAVTLAAAPTLVGNGSSGIPNIGLINNPVFAFASAGQKFRIRAELGAPGFNELSCHIGGQLKP